MNAIAFKAFLASQQAGFESFLVKYQDMSLDDMNKMLSKHCRELQRALEAKCHQLGDAKAPSSPVTSPRVAPSRVKARIPTRTPDGKPLSVGGAGTVFKTGSGTKRRAFTLDSDSSPEAIEVRTKFDTSPISRLSKRRQASKSKIKKPTIKDMDDYYVGDESLNEETLADMTPNVPMKRRPGSGQNTSMKNPFISN
jgi:hypothetical protein